MYDLTSRNIDPERARMRNIAVIVNDVVVITASLAESFSRNALISPRFSHTSMEDFVADIRASSLSQPLKRTPSSETTVEPQP